MQSTDVRFEQVFFQAVDGQSCILLCDRPHAPVVFFCLGRLYTPSRLKSALALKGFKTVCPQMQLAMPALLRRQRRCQGLRLRPGHF